MIKQQFFKLKYVEITKPKNAFKSFTNSYNVEIFNSFDSELQLKDTDVELKVV